jgi:hypothetical protein
MFDKYIIDPGSVRNTGPSRGARPGSRSNPSLATIAGSALSMVEELNVGIDGEAIFPRSMRSGLTRAAGSADARSKWKPRSTAAGRSARRPRFMVEVSQAVFPKGEHTLSLQQKLRISYMPFPSFNNDEKQVSFG